MALKQPYMVKTGLASDTLKLKADTGESFLVKAIEVDNLANVEFAKILIDRVTVAYLSVYDMYQNQFYFARDRSRFPNLMEYLFGLGLFAGFPVAEGQELTVDVTGATNKNSRIIYEIHDAGDILPTMPNGTESLEYTYWNYGTNSVEIAINSSGLIDKSLTPKEFPDFPFGEIVPAKTQIEILALLVGTHRIGVYVGDKYRYLKFMKGREVLFDEDRLGLYVAHGMGDFPFHSENYELIVNPFPAPVSFLPGDELNLSLSVGGVALALDTGLFCLYEKVTRVE